MQTIITMKYSEKSNIPLIYAERYGIIYKKIRRENKEVFINVPINEYITDINTIRIIGDILSNVLRAEPVRSITQKKCVISTKSMVSS